MHAADQADASGRRWQAPPLFRQLLRCVPISMHGLRVFHVLGAQSHVAARLLAGDRMRRHTVMMAMLGFSLSLAAACGSSGGGGTGGAGGSGGPGGAGRGGSGGGSGAGGHAGAGGGVAGTGGHGGGVSGAGGAAGAGGGVAGSGGIAGGTGGTLTGGAGGRGGTGGSGGVGGGPGGHGGLGGGQAGTGGGGTGGGGGAPGTGGAHACAATCNRCAAGVCCGSACCGAGEWCDSSGAAPTCRCGGGDACTGGNTCNAPTIDPGNPCGVVCCSGSACPVSRRVFKREIHELDRSELARVYAELRDIRLTTYQYKAEPAGARRRLGFIIDDTRSAYPINADGASVDLYGYVSMAVAAIQSQSREIQALHAEIAALKHQHK